MTSIPRPQRSSAELIAFAIMALTLALGVALWNQKDHWVIASIAAFVALGVYVGRWHKQTFIRHERAWSMLASTLETADNGMLIVGENDELLHANRHFKKMWELDDNRPLPLRAQQLFAMIREQLRSAEGFDQWLEVLVASSARCAVETFTDKNGRIFELSLFPMPFAGCSTGKLWSFRDVSDRGFIGQELRENAARYRFIAENTEDVIWAYDLKSSRFTFASPSVDKLRGYTPNEVLQQSLKDVLTQESYGKALELLEEATKTHSLDRRTERFVTLLDQVRKDGSTVPTEVVATVVFNKDGHSEQVIGVTRDVTERTRVEVALRASEARYKRLVEHGYDLVSETDADFRFIYVSPNHKSVLGYFAEDLLRHAIVEFIHPDDIPTAIKAGRVTRTHGSSTIVVRFRHEDGSWLWLETIVRCYQTETGDPRIVTISRDITNRRQIELARERLLQILESSLNEVYAFDAESLCFEYVNRCACRNLGYEALTLRTMTITDLTPRMKAEEFRETVAPLLEHQLERIRFESVHRRADGTDYPIDVQIQLVEDAGLRVFLAVALDITELKRAETQHRQLEEQLQLSRKLETIGSLAGGVAHDFNNILAVILNCTDFAMEGLLTDDPRLRDLTSVKLAAERGANLTRQLLAFSRKQVVKPVLLNLNQVITTLQKMLPRILGEDIQVILSFAPDLGFIRADPTQIEQVIMNLAVNARDAMRQGGRLILETYNVEVNGTGVEQQGDLAPGRYVSFIVSDTGHGMDAKTQSRIFEPFFTTKEPGRGTGLGLATVYGIVHQCGGSIWVDSKLEQGTTFKLYFPREANTQNVATTPYHSDYPSLSELRGAETVLLVEDDDALRQVIERQLKCAGYHVICASNGADALRKAEQFSGQIALLVTDVVMPKLNGRDTAESLTQSRPGLSVLYISGYTDDTLADHGVLRDGIQVLVKPFTMPALLSKTRQVLTDKCGA